MMFVFIFKLYINSGFAWFKTYLQSNVQLINLFDHNSQCARFANL